MQPKLATLSRGTPLGVTAEPSFAFDFPIVKPAKVLKSPTRTEEPEPAQRPVRRSSTSRLRRSSSAAASSTQYVDNWRELPGAGPVPVSSALTESTNFRLGQLEQQIQTAIDLHGLTSHSERAEMLETLRAQTRALGEAIQSLSTKAMASDSSALTAEFWSELDVLKQRQQRNLDLVRELMEARERSGESKQMASTRSFEPSRTTIATDDEDVLTEVLNDMPQPERVPSASPAKLRSSSGPEFSAPSGPRFVAFSYDSFCFAHCPTLVRVSQSANSKSTFVKSKSERKSRLKFDLSQILHQLGFAHQRWMTCCRRR